MKTSLAVLGLVGVSPFTLAQAKLPEVGDVKLDADMTLILSALIGWLVKEVASPLTALLKSRYGFQGNVTRTVYLVLSTVAVALYGLGVGAFGQGADGFKAAVAALLVALVKGFGDYLREQQLTEGALRNLFEVPTKTAQNDLSKF